MTPPVPTSASGGGGGSRQYQRHRRQRGRGGGRHRKNAPRGEHNRSNMNEPPLAPYVKVMIRNVQDATKYGTCRPLVENLIVPLVQRANEKLATLAADSEGLMNLDLVHLEELIHDEEAYLAAQKEWQETQRQQQNDQDEAKEEQEADVPDTKEVDAVDQPSEDAKGHDSEAAEPQQLAWDLQSKLKISSPTALPTSGGINTRVLYMVPPRKTKRRGTKPGCAYLLLQSPPIEARQPVVAVPATTPAESEEGKDADGTTAPPPAPAAPPPPVDYSRDVAQRRFHLTRAVEALTEQATLDRTSHQEWAGCVVEESLYDKVWKTQLPLLNQQASDNKKRYHKPLEGSIAETSDYQEFFAQKALRNEEVSNRPKPAPGGSSHRFVAAATTTGTTASAAAGVDNEPVAALVLHLQAKREAAAKGRRLGKKKKKYKAEPIAQPKVSNNAVQKKKKRKKKAIKGGSKKFAPKPKPDGPTAGSAS